MSNCVYQVVCTLHVCVLQDTDESVYPLAMLKDEGLVNMYSSMTIL